MSLELSNFAGLLFLILTLSGTVTTWAIVCVHHQYPKTDNPYRWKVKFLSASSAIFAIVSMGFNMYSLLLQKALGG